jgi:hypothetical protein
MIGSGWRTIFSIFPDLLPALDFAAQCSYTFVQISLRLLMEKRFREGSVESRAFLP